MASLITPQNDLGVRFFLAWKTGSELFDMVEFCHRSEKNFSRRSNFSTRSNFVRKSRILQAIEKNFLTRSNLQMSLHKMMDVCSTFKCLIPFCLCPKVGFCHFVYIIFSIWPYFAVKYKIRRLVKFICRN